MQSLSPHGLARYVTHNRVLDDGYVHMLSRAASVHTFGSSVMALRLAGVAFGVLSIAFCYLLARQLVGPGLAGAARILLRARRV